MIVGDLQDDIHNVQSLEFIKDHFNINMNFLEYNSPKLKLNEFLEYKYQEKPDFIAFHPRNNSINILLNIEKKVFPTFTKKLHCTSENILFDICDKWE